ncbi:MAG: tRNA (N(6)-L-threonylcarbamoyladenosine(37)-C(2))-methylthiotransferase MtaB [Lachnospiraceae bacterium]|nr:tRNA (N(6)-L-threonylcarbamoyladenosine(37)-C(2))-methylthiotransferase MtaB [Lachnospiraceae bacterium]
MYLKNLLLNKKAAFLSLGCKVNAYETEVMRQCFMSYGAVPVDFKEIADIYVVNTCTVTNIADRKSRQMLHRAKSLNPEAVIVAVGCYVQESAEELEKDGAVNVLIGNRLKNKVADIVNEYLVSCMENLENKEKPLTVMNNDEQDYEELCTISDYKNLRVDIKIQDGCNQFCSYCIIPYARGRISSRKPESVLNEVKSLAERGFKEVVLTGIHLSSYGLEDYSVREQANLKTDDGRMPLLELIEKISEIDGIERIRTGSVEPRIITEEFVERLSKCTRFMPHFHLSLQSGSDGVLKRMNRKYDTAMYEKACDILREYYYKPSITTDIIVGFPGETKEEFEECCEFAEKIGFSAIHIFPYSVRKGTKAAGMPDQLDNNIKGDRAKKLAEIEEKLRIDYENSFADEFRNVLCEEIIEFDGKIYITGHTEEYVKTIFEANDALPGDIVMVKMSGKRLKNMVFAEV